MSNENELFARPAREAKIYDLEHFGFWENTPDRPGFRSKMLFSERNGAPRISVFPNSETGPKVIFVGMAPLVFMEFLNRLETIAKGPKDAVDKIVNMMAEPSEDREAARQPGNVPKIVKNTLWFGKDEQGVCWISIEQANIPRIRFRILSSAWHKFYKSDGTELTPEDCSVPQTLALVEALKLTLARYMGRLRVPFERSEQKTTFRDPSDPTTISTANYIDDDVRY